MSNVNWDIAQLREALSQIASADVTGMNLVTALLLIEHMKSVASKAILLDDERHRPNP